MEKNFKLSDTKLSDIEIEGKIIFIYSDKFDIYFFIEDCETNSLYQITTDKYFYIKYIEKVEIPEEYFSYEKIKFSKPIEKQDIIIFIGVIKYKDKAFKFNINNTNLKFEYVEEINYVNIPQIVNEFEELREFEFISFIQKKNNIYGVAYDTTHNIDCYIKFNVDKKSIIKCYSLYSDVDDIFTTTVNVDAHEDKVYIGGYRKNIETKVITPYFEYLSM